MNRISLILGILVTVQVTAVDCALAQRVRFPSETPPTQTTSQFPAQLPGTTSVQPGWRTIPPYPGGPSATISPPTFDGFSSQPPASVSPAMLPPVNVPANAFPQGAYPQGAFPQGAYQQGAFPPPPAYPGQPPAGFSGSVQPMIIPPGGFSGSTGPPQYPSNPLFQFPSSSGTPRVQPPGLQMPNFQPQDPYLQSPGYQPTAAVNGPSTWFDGWQWPAIGGGLTNTGSKEGSRDWIGRSFWSKFEKGPYLNLFQEFRFGHTYLYGNENNQLQIHDTEFGTTINYPNFFGSGEPLRLSPGFIFHSWDGPQPPHPGLTADLPGQAYSAFLATDFSTPAARQLGADLNFSTGLYTDFNTLTSESLRFKGTALGRLRLADDLTMRFGVNYLDRLKYKLLPAFGFFWTPTPDARIELFFPYPKMSRRLPQFGNAETWAYVRGQLGGDTFTIRRASGADDQVDIVDYRVLGGVEWSGHGGATGFLEGGFVFNRELIYRFAPQDNLDLDNTIMIRTGLAF